MGELKMLDEERLGFSYSLVAQPTNERVVYAACQSLRVNEVPEGCREGDSDQPADQSRSDGRRVFALVE